MKLVQPDFFFPIDFKENQIETIVIEKPELFSDMVFQLKSHINGEGDFGWVLSAGNKLLDMEKTCEIIINPFDVDINNRKLQNALYEKLETEINSTDNLFVWNELCGKMEKELQKFLEPMDYNITYSENIAIKDFLKLMKVCFQEDSVNYFEKLLDYMRLEQKILKVRLFVLVNIKGFLNLEQLHFLYQQSCYDKFQLLLIESYMDEQKRIGGERVFIIDNDSCVIC